MTEENEIKLLNAMHTQGICIQRLQDVMMLMTKSMEIMNNAIEILQKKIETIEVVQELLKPLDKDDRRG